MTPVTVVGLFVLSISLSGCKARFAPSISEALGAGTDKLSVCTGARPISGNGNSAFDFVAPDFSLKNAYWLAAMASNVYSRKEVIIKEAERLGFSESNDLVNDSHLSFMDQVGISQTTGIRYADTQALWAENKEGVILAFRGTETTDLADIVTDIFKSEGSLLIGTEEEVIGQALAVASNPDAGDRFETPENRDIRVHLGFWYALDVVWKDIEGRAKQIIAKGRDEEKRKKSAILDGLVAQMDSVPPAAFDAKLRALSDWRPAIAGKRNILKQWKLTQTNPARRDELYQLLNSNWVSTLKPIWITGHSLGGGLATLAAYRLLKMGANVKGLYTFGSPRVGNHAFVHDLRVVAYEKGLKTFGGEGNMARFVHHFDVVTRVPPVFGWASVIDESSMNPFLDKFDHAAKMRYITDSETDAPEIWIKGKPEFDEQFALHKVPQYTVSMALEKWKMWAGDHSMPKYAAKIEKIAFGTQTPCP